LTAASATTIHAGVVVGWSIFQSRKILCRAVRFYGAGVIIPKPGANPTIVNCNFSVVKIDNTTNSPVRLENKKFFLNY
jgi:hypothetical protein